MKELILSYIEQADNGHLHSGKHQLTDSERQLIIETLQCILADAAFKNLL
jgi:hypothetical protein